MDYLQYTKEQNSFFDETKQNSFKPYYKWITFNTTIDEFASMVNKHSFKPYYKWITFNT